MKLYGIPNCDTVKRARAWLAGQGTAYDFHDFKKGGVPEARLDAWLKAVGWERLLNRQGTTWRKLDVPHDWSIEGPFNELQNPGNSGCLLAQTVVGLSTRVSANVTSYAMKYSRATRMCRL